MAKFDQLSQVASECERLYRSADTRRALSVSTEGVARARLCGDDNWLRMLLTAHGILQADLHNLPEALEAFSEALDICERLADPYYFSSVWANLGAALLYFEFFDLANAAALVAQEYAAQVGDRDKSSDIVAHSLSNVGYASLFTHEYARGLRATRRAIELIVDRRTRSQSRASSASTCNLALALTILGRLLLRVGSVEEACRHIAEANRLAQSTSNERTIIGARVAAALCDGYCAQFEASRASLLLISQSAFIKSPELLSDVLRDLAEVHAIAGRHVEGTSYWQQLCRRAQETKAADVVFHHRRHLQRLAPDRFSGIERASQDRHFGPPLRRGRRLLVDRREVLEELSTAAELHDDPSGLHSYRVSELARLLAFECGLPEDDCDEIARAARLHDVGKIAVPPAILRKPGSLTDDETLIMRSHVTIGAEILDSVEIGNKGTALQVARHHHEWWSGAGYPDGLERDAIPIAARIAAIAEALDAMTHRRAYRPGLTLDGALDVIASRSGLQFDPSLVDVFCQMVRKLHDVHTDLDRFLERGAQRSGFLRTRERIADRIRCHTR